MNAPSCSLVALPAGAEGADRYLRCETCSALVAVEKAIFAPGECPGRPQERSAAP